jgi:xanthine dehydrogenase accessory factor
MTETSGALRGIAHNGLPVTVGCKVGDIDPRNDAGSCFTISDKANAIAGGVMEAVFNHFRLHS